MTSSDRRGRPRGHPTAWSWSDAKDLLFEHSTPPERMLSTDQGQPRTLEELQAFCMKQALREACERTATLLNEAGISLDDLSHLNPNKGRGKTVANEMDGYL